MNRAEVYALVDDERRRQSLLFDGAHPWGEGDCSSPLVAPIVQVAAVAVAWLESLP